jgi:hypothetical protein
LRGSDRIEDEPKLSGAFTHKSALRDAVLQAITKHPGWVKAMTIAAETGMGTEAARKQLQRLSVVGLVDRDGKGRYRKHHERKLRKLKPCCSKPLPSCHGTSKMRKTLSFTELSRRGWPKTLIDETFPRVGIDYVTKNVEVEGLTRMVQARFCWVSRIRAIERQPWFETCRAEHLTTARERKVAR